MSNGRDLRLQSDYEHLRKLALNSGGTFEIETVRGRPPDQYILIYRCRSIESLKDGKPVFSDLHRVQIDLPSKYPAPFAAPHVKMLTPIWHPHVYKNRVVCMGSWITSEFLDDFALRLGSLLQFEKEFFDIRDPANEEAVDWARKNLLLFPTDTCTFHNDPPVREHLPPGFTPLMSFAGSNDSSEDIKPAEDYRSASGVDDEGIIWNEI